MVKFVPRVITAGMAAEGYNNEGRGELLGYIAYPDQHENTCRYRITTGGDPDKREHEACTCRIGLWRETIPAQKVVNQMRKTVKRAKKTAPTKSKAKKTKGKRNG